MPLHDNGANLMDIHIVDLKDLYTAVELMYLYTVVDG